MIKTILLVRRRADLTIERFRDHYGFIEEAG